MDIHPIWEILWREDMRPLRILVTHEVERHIANPANEGAYEAK